jgi:hypothetical protein
MLFKEGYFAKTASKKPTEEHVPIFFVGDSDRYKIHMQCLIFYEDFNYYLKSYLEYKLAKLLQEISN